MPSYSTQAAAVAALLALFRGSSPVAAMGADVVDGQQPPSTVNIAAVTVGWSPNPLVESAVEGRSGIADLGGKRDLEEYAIHCAAQYIDGDSDAANARAQADSLASAVRETIALNRNLGGLQGLASFGQGETKTEALETGVKVTVAFDVDVKAFTDYKA